MGRTTFLDSVFLAGGITVIAFLVYQIVVTLIGF